MSKSEKSIDAMAKDIRRGDYSDLTKLLQYCAYIPKEMLEKAEKLGYEKEDIYQESVIALLRALHSYDEEQGTGFKTYSSVCIKNHIVSLLRAGMRQKSAAMIDYVSIDEAEILSENGPENEWIQKEEFADTKNQIFSALSDFENKVLSLYLEGFSYKIIGEKLGKTEKSISNALSRVRKKLRNKLLPEK